MKIVEIGVNKLTPYERNAKLHPAEQVDQIVESIRRFGFIDPIGIWGDKNIVVEGHGRLLAAKQLGLEQVPCIRLDHLSDEERRAYALAHNQTTMSSGWDSELLAFELSELKAVDMVSLGFSEFYEKTELDDVKEDTPPQPPTKPITKLGDVYQLGNHRLICGDCTDKAVIDKLMNGVQADLIITDPPYNVNYESSTTGQKIANDNLPEIEFEKFLEKSFERINEVLKQGGAWYIFHSDSGGETFRKVTRERLGKIRQCLIWNKNQFILGRQDYHWKHEPILYGWKDGQAHYFIEDRTQSTVYIGDYVALDKLSKKDAIQMLKEILQNEEQTTVIDCDKPTVNADHPTMKPVKLIARLMSNSSRKGEIVFDPFGGSGSTLIAAEQLGRICYTCELDPKYCDVVVKRWEELTKGKAKLINQ